MRREKMKGASGSRLVRLNCRKLRASLCSQVSTSEPSRRLRSTTVAKANSAVRPKPSNRKETMIRLRSRRRKCGALSASLRTASSAGLGVGDTVADAVAGLDQRLFEGLVDRGAQAVDVHAQAVRVRQFLAP